MQEKERELRRRGVPRVAALCVGLALGALTGPVTSASSQLLPPILGGSSGSQPPPQQQPSSTPPAPGNVSLLVRQADVVYGQSIMLEGQVDGPQAGGRKVGLSINRYPFKFWDYADSTTTDANGRFRFSEPSYLNVQYRAVLDNNAASSVVAVFIFPRASLRPPSVSRRQVHFYLEFDGPESYFAEEQGYPGSGPIRRLALQSRQVFLYARPGRGSFRRVGGGRLQDPGAGTVRRAYLSARLTRFVARARLFVACTPAPPIQGLGRPDPQRLCGRRVLPSSIR